MQNTTLGQYRLKQGENFNYLEVNINNNNKMQNEVRLIPDATNHKQ